MGDSRVAFFFTRINERKIVVTVEGVGDWGGTTGMSFATTSIPLKMFGLNSEAYVLLQVY